MRTKLTPLQDEARATIPTNEAAEHLGRKPQTMRLWHMRGNGPLRPVVIYGKLAWPVADIKRLVGLEA